MTNTMITISKEISGITVSVSASFSSENEVSLTPAPDMPEAAAVHPDLLPLLASEIASLLPQAELAVVRFQNQALEHLISKEIAAT